MKVKDSRFYNKESQNYSSKRYPKQASTYVQHFFKRRLSILLDELGKLYLGKSNLGLLEVGCADGVVVRAISVAFPQRFSKIVGIDTASEMIRTAKSLSKESNIISFYERGTEPAASYDAVVEVGVANYADFDEELMYAKKALARGGLYILSVAGKDSLNARMGQGVGYRNLNSYSEYEMKIASAFKIEKAIPVGLYIPLIWRIPEFARVIQPLTESFAKMICPNLFHEKIYVLSVK